MRVYLKCLLLSCFLIGATACEKTDPIDGAGAACVDASDCPQAAAICDVAGGSVCVQCLPGVDVTACTGLTPTCGPDKSCQACKVHADCAASDACLPSGECAAEGEVVYLRSNGSVNGSSMCTKESACAVLDTAISRVTATRPYIRVTGTIEFANGDIDGKTVKFLGEQSAVLRGGQFGGGTDEPILDFSNGAKVEIYDLTLRDARREGVRVDDAASTLLLQRSKIENAGFDGVLVSNNGKASIIQSEIRDCDNATRYGINIMQGQVIVERSKIADNSGGIYIADNQLFQIVNNFIVENKTLGGVRALKPATGSKLEFNTIADNRFTANGAGDAGGLICDDENFTFSGNIIYRNLSGTASDRFLQTFGNCMLGNSLVSSNTAAETRVLSFLKDTAPRDHHLTAASPALVKDVAGATCSAAVDYDGETRPQGGACDLGADEVK